MSSHRFLLRRVWHLAIPTPPAMGYSPTEYAEFTEPPTEMSSHGFHRSAQMLGCAVLPQNSQNSQNLLLRCPPTDFTDLHRYLGCAVLPQNTPNSQNLLLRCPPTDFTDLHRYLGCAVLPQNSQNTQNLAAWVWQGCHTLLHLCHLWESFLCKRFCAFRAFCGNLFPPTDFRFTQMLRVRFVPTEFTESTEFVSVGMAGMPYPPTSVNIRAVCGRLFSARGSVSSVLICGRLFSARSFCAFRAFCGNIFSPTEFTESTEFVSVGIAGMPYLPTSVLIRVICGRLFSARGSVYSVYSVGASSPLVLLVQQRLLHPLA